MLPEVSPLPSCLADLPGWPYVTVSSFLFSSTPQGCTSWTPCSWANSHDQFWPMSYKQHNVLSLLAGALSYQCEIFWNSLLIWYPGEQKPLQTTVDIQWELACSKRCRMSGSIWISHKHAIYNILLFSLSVPSDSLQPHGLQHTRLTCPSLSPRVCLNSCPLSQRCHPTISCSATSFSSCPQS